MVYHNAFREASGWIRESAAFAQKTGVDDDKVLVRRTLAAGLGLTPGDDWYSILRDERSGLEYLRSNAELRDQGLYLELGAYRCQVFLDPRQVREAVEQPYGQLAARLAGRGVPSIDEALAELRLEPIRRPFEELVNAELLGRLLAARVSSAADSPDPTLLTEIEARVGRLVEAAQWVAGGAGLTAPVVQTTMARIRALLGLAPNGSAAARTAESDLLPGTEAAVDAATDYLNEQPLRWAALLGWAVVSPLDGLVRPDPATRSANWSKDWRLDRSLGRAIEGLGLDAQAAELATGLTGVLGTYGRAFLTGAGRSPRTILTELLDDGDVRRFLDINEHQGEQWFSKERFDDLLGGLLTAAVITGVTNPTATREQVARELAACYELIAAIRDGEQRSGYRVDRLLKEVAEARPTGA